MTTNLEQLRKLAEVFNTDNIITPAEIEQVLTGIMQILATYKKQTETLNLDTKQTVNNLLGKVEEKYNEVVYELDKRTENIKTQLFSDIEEAKQILNEVKAIEVTDGKDADEEIIVEKVLAKIPKNEILDTPETIANKLETLQGDGRLDASAIKGLEKFFSKGKDGSMRVIGGQTGLRLFVNEVKKGLIQSLDLKAGSNVTLTASKVNGLDTLTIASTGGSGSFYTETVSGTINSSNVTFTVPTTITTALVLFLGGVPYQPTTDFTTSGSTITMLVAPDSSLSGQPFFLIHT